MEVALVFVGVMAVVVALAVALLTLSEWLERRSVQLTKGSTPAVICAFESADGKRRAEVYCRADGTFGFQESHFAEDDMEVPTGYWAVARDSGGSRTDSVEAALREARGCISWLADNGVRVAPADVGDGEPAV